MPEGCSGTTIFTHLTGQQCFDFMVYPKDLQCSGDHMQAAVVTNQCTFQSPPGQPAVATKVTNSAADAFVYWNCTDSQCANCVQQISGNIGSCVAYQGASARLQGTHPCDALRIELFQPTCPNGKETSSSWIAIDFCYSFNGQAVKYEYSSLTMTPWAPPADHPLLSALHQSLKQF